MQKSITTHIIFLFFAVASLITACKKEEEEAPNPQVTVTQLRPAIGNAGDTIQIIGKGFALQPETNKISFNGKSTTAFLAEGDSVLSVVVPEEVTSGAVAVSNQREAAEGPVFQVASMLPAPVLSSVSSSDLQIGETFSITGQNFISGAYAAKNIVRIGKARVPVVRATAAELIATVPAGVFGSNLSLTVSVEGKSSNEVKVNVTGFTGTLHWLLLPNINAPLDGFSQFVVSAPADGSVTGNRPYYTVPDDSAETKLKLLYPLDGTKAYSQKDNKFFVFMRGEVKQFSPNWTSLETYYNPSIDNFLPTGASAVEQASGNFYLTGSKDGKLSIFQVERDKLTRFSNIILQEPVSLQGGAAAFYLLDKGTIRRIPTDAAEATERIDLSLLPKLENGTGLSNLQYSHLDKNLYFFYEPKWGEAVQLYKYDEATRTLALISHSIPSGANHLTLYDNVTGVKLYFTLSNQQLPIEQNLWLLNLKPNKENEYGPILLYKHLTVIPERAETNGVYGNKSYNSVDFIAVDQD